MREIPKISKKPRKLRLSPKINKVPDTHASNYQAYLEERRALDNALLEESKSFDKYVLTIASGSFGLSLLFIRQLVPVWQPETLPLLIASWISFGASIFFTLLSLLISQHACLRQIEILDKWLCENIGNPSSTKNLFRVLTLLLNWFSMLAFLSGVVLLILFAARNLFP